MASSNPPSSRSDTTGHRPTRGSFGTVAGVVVGLIVAAAAIGWAVVVGNVSGQPSVAAQVVSFRVVADHTVLLSYEVAKPTGASVRCFLVAYDTRHAEVARTATQIPPGTDHVERTERIRTSARATAVTVRDCRTG